MQNIINNYLVHIVRNTINSPKKSCGFVFKYHYICPIFCGDTCGKKKFSRKVIIKNHKYHNEYSIDL